jgi:ribonuclease G
MLNLDTSEKCPTCLGTGQTKPSLLFTETLEEKIEILTQKLHMKKFKLHVHPYVYAYITKGLVSLLMKWKWKYCKGIKMIPDQSLGMLEYKFYDLDKNEFEVNDNLEIK